MADQGKLKWVEIRRHSGQDRTGNLSQEGKTLASRVGNMLAGSYVTVVTSGAPRAVQTAEAFGFASSEVDGRLAVLSMPEGFMHEAETLSEKKGLTQLEAYFSIPGCRSVLREVGKKAVALVMEIAQKLEPGQRALCLSHGGTIEAGALVALQQEFSLGVFGGEFAECEGVSFIVEGSKVVAVDLHRLAGE